MFEAVLTLCLAMEAAVCRPVLLPGYEAATAAACRNALAARPPGAGDWPGDLVARGAPECRPSGPVLAFEAQAPGLFVHRGAIAEANRENGGDISNIVFVVGDRSVAVIDSGSARWIGEAVWRAVRARTDLPVSHLILSHVHPDHVFGASALVAAGAQVVGHAGLDRALADRQANYLESLSALIGPERLIGTVAVPVDLAVGETMEIDLGGLLLEVAARPSAHSGTDLTVLDRATETLIAGDLIFDGHLPTLDGSVTGWQAVLDDLAQMSAQRVVPGHGGPLLPWPEGAADTARYLDVLARDTRAAIEEGLSLGRAVEGIAAEERALWHLFDAFNARNATVAYTELEWE